jgi:hypothetical protein
MPVDRASYMVGRTDKKYYDRVLTIDACGQALRAETTEKELKTHQSGSYQLPLFLVGWQLLSTWRNRRLPSPPQINSSVRPSVSHISFNYSAENFPGPTDLVNKYVKIVNRRGIVCQIFFIINLYIMILAKIRVICILY